jgi:hypothetical protein
MPGVYRILFLFSLVLLVNFGLKGQPNTFYFMKGVVQTREMNPAKHGLESGYYVSLPLLSSMDVSANTNNWNFNDLVHKGAGLQKDSMIWDFENLLKTFDQKNYLRESASLTFAEYGWKKKQNFFALSISEHETAEPFFEKPLAEFLYYGNEPLIGTTFKSGDFGLMAQHYRQFAFTYSRQNSRKLSTGITGKLLFGMAGIATKGIGFETVMPASGDQINFKGSGDLYLSGPVEIVQSQPNGYDLQFSNSFKTGKYLLNFGNPGLAVDLGLTYKVLKKLELSVSLIDLGFINWRNNLSSLTEDGNFAYEGIQLNAPGKIPPTASSFQPLLDNLKDSIVKAFPLELTSKRFSTLLPAKLYLGGEYTVIKNVSIAALASIRMFKKQLYGSYTASVNAVLGKSLTLTAAYTYFESTPNNLGLGLSYKFRGLQLYAATDNVVSPFYPNQASYLNLRVGINLLFPEPDRIEQRRRAFMPKVRNKYHRF